MNIENLLHEEIENRLKDLKSMAVKTDEYKAAVDGVAKLVDRAIELEKVNNEIEDKEKSRIIDEEIRTRQIEEDKKDRKAKNLIAVATIAVPSILTVWGTLKSLKFEESGTVTTIVGRGFINKLLPKK